MYNMARLFPLYFPLTLSKMLVFFYTLKLTRFRDGGNFYKFATNKTIPNLVKMQYTLKKKKRYYRS